MGLDTRFSTEINGKAPLARKQFQKTVGRIFDDDSVELGKKFLSQFPALKDCKATLSGRTIRLAGPNIAVLPPLEPMAQQRQAFFDELDQNTRLSAGASLCLVANSPTKPSAD